MPMMLPNTLGQKNRRFGYATKHSWTKEQKVRIKLYNKKWVVGTVTSQCMRPRGVEGKDCAYYAISIEVPLGGQWQSPAT